MSPKSYPKLNRKPNGIPLFPNRDLVAADLVALVAGVSGGAVAKVLIALEAVAEGLGVPVQSLVDAASVPTAPADVYRTDETTEAANDLADQRHLMERYEDALGFLYRHDKRR